MDTAQATECSLCNVVQVLIKIEGTLELGLELGPD